jgi:hypothetical protein
LTTTNYIKRNSTLYEEYKERKKAIMSLVPAGGNWRNLPMDIQKEYMKNSLYFIAKIKSIWITIF